MLKKNRKTRKIRKRLGHTPLGKCCEATYTGIQKWYVSLFEKVGWMILANDRGMTDKVHTYLESVKRIELAIQQKLQKTVDPDHREDLLIMERNIQVLSKHLKKDFPKN